MKKKDDITLNGDGHEDDQKRKISADDLPKRCLDAERIDWFVEDQAFLRSYDWAPSPPPPPPRSANCLSFSVFLSVAGPGHGAQSNDCKKAWASMNRPNPLCLKVSPTLLHGGLDSWRQVTSKSVYLMGEYSLLGLVDEHENVLPQGRVHFRWTLG